MSLIDFAVLAVYLAGMVVLGSWFSKSHHDVRDYFVSGRTIPCPIHGSHFIEAEETIFNRSPYE